MRRANAYLKKEQLYNAKSDLEKALEISPKDETVVKELSKIKQIINVWWLYIMEMFWCLMNFGY